MQSYVLQQIDLNDVKSILDLHREQMKKELEEMINEVSLSPVIVSRAKLIEILDCSSSWLSKVTANGEMPSVTIGGRVFYDLKEIKNQKALKKYQIRKKQRGKHDIND